MVATHNRTSPPDMVKSPNHYTNNGKADVEPIDLIAGLSMCRGSAIRYLCRAGLKNPDLEIQDLEKARMYIEFEIRRLRGEPVSDTLRAWLKEVQEE